MRRRHLITFAAAMAVGLMTAPLSAQEIKAAPAAKDSRPQTRATEKSDASRDDQEKRARGTAQRFLQHEHRHRMRVARLKRLREIAREQGDEARLARLDEVEARLAELHRRHQAMARERLGDDRFDALVDQVRERDVRRTAARRQHRQEKREHWQDRREDVRDHREDVRDRREDVRDHRKDASDRREDVRDRREDVRDRRGDVRDRREDVRDRREDVRDRRGDRRNDARSGRDKARTGDGKGGR